MVFMPVRDNVFFLSQNVLFAEIGVELFERFLCQGIADLQQQEHAQIHHERHNGRNGINAFVDGICLNDNILSSAVPDSCQCH